MVNTATSQSKLKERKKDVQKYLNGALSNKDKGIVVEPIALTVNDCSNKWL
jgi:hypothetical protein